MIGLVGPRLIVLFSWIEAEKACSKALQQHRSSKGLYRRARARRMLGRTEEAIGGIVSSTSNPLFNRVHP